MPPTQQSPPEQAPPETLLETTLEESEGMKAVLVPQPEDHTHVTDVPEDELHQAHLVKLILHDGTEEMHVMAVGGGGGRGLTTEQLAEHLTVHDHFKGRAKKIIIKRGGARTIKANLAKIINNPKAVKLMEAQQPVKVEVEPKSEPALTTESIPEPEPSEPA